MGTRTKKKNHHKCWHPRFFHTISRHFNDGSWETFFAKDGAVIANVGIVGGNGNVVGTIGIGTIGVGTIGVGITGVGTTAYFLFK